MAFCITSWGGARRQGSPDSVSAFSQRTAPSPTITRGSGSLRSSSASSARPDGAVRRPAGQAAMFGGEEGVVDLATPGVHGADHQGVHVGHVPGHGLQGGDGRAGLVRGKGQSLAAETPMRMPVKDPGPAATATASQSWTVRPVFFSMASTMGIRVRLWVRPVS